MQNSSNFLSAKLKIEEICGVCKMKLKKIEHDLTVSTYNTDYILVKRENFERALEVFGAEGYTIV